MEDPIDGIIEKDREQLVQDLSAVAQDPAVFRYIIEEHLCLLMPVSEGLKKYLLLLIQDSDSSLSHAIEEMRSAALTGDYIHVNFHLDFLSQKIERVNWEMWEAIVTDMEGNRKEQETLLTELNQLREELQADNKELAELLHLMGAAAQAAGQRNAAFGERLAQLDNELLSNIRHVLRKAAKRESKQFAAYLEKVKDELELALEVAGKRNQNRVLLAGLGVIGIAAVGSVYAYQKFADLLEEMKSLSNETRRAVDEEQLAAWSVSEHGFEDTVNQVEAMDVAGLVVNCGSFDPESGLPSEFARINSPSVKGWMSKADVLEACEGSSEVKFRVEY